MRLILIIFFALVVGSVKSQIMDTTSYKNFWTANKRAMISLTVWSSVNITSSVAFNNQLKGELKYFNQMNGGWNLVNLGLAVPGLIKSNRMLKYPDMESWNADKLKLPKIYKVNFYLDFFYIGAGTTMTLLAKQTKNPELIGGFGKSVILQGTYLLAFDFIMNRLLRKKGGTF